MLIFNLNSIFLLLYSIFKGFFCLGMFELCFHLQTFCSSELFFPAMTCCMKLCVCVALIISQACTHHNPDK